jgi:hypothetical protein
MNLKTPGNASSLRIGMLRQVKTYRQEVIAIGVKQSRKRIAVSRLQNR